MASRKPAAAATPPDHPLASYWRKRDFTVTAEPHGDKGDSTSERVFVIQKHAASHLHYDFRLEIDGVMASWAVPKGPSFDPAVKRLAVQVEDHPMDYNTFEGSIPAGQYGAGTVIIWDRGFWTPTADPAKGLRDGKLAFTLHGHKMAGLWELVRTNGRGARQTQWLLFKKRDGFARAASDYDVVSALPDSVVGQTVKPPPSARTAKANALPVKPARVSKGRDDRKTIAAVPGAVAAQLPKRLSPQLATLANGIPDAGPWVYEIKFDGYRMLAKVDNGTVALITRNGHDWTDKLPVLAKEIGQLGLQSAWLDGELVVMDGAGKPSFHALQNALDSPHSADIQFFLFDVPHLQGFDLCGAALRDRRRLLEALLSRGKAEHLQFSAGFDADPATILASACQLQLEGVIAKRAEAHYESGRSSSWLKLKCGQRQEFVICGYTDRSDGSPQIGSLVLGVHGDAGALVSVGNVGTGWDAKEARMLQSTLRALRTAKAPFSAATTARRRSAKGAAEPTHWVKPTLVAEVAFGQWTPSGNLRHAKYLGLRSDKSARGIVRETAASAAGTAKMAAADPGPTLTHGDRVIDAASGLTKRDLARYYASVVDWLFPHLKGRPVSLVRGPAGVGGQLFFQKHGTLGIEGLRELDADLWPGHAPLLEVASEKGVVGAAQMNVIEWHTWNSTTRSIELPDRMVFDLDPGTGVEWSQMQESALLVHTLLGELGLACWLKTSGGKGLHVVVPMAPHFDYDTVKRFSKSLVQYLAKTLPTRFVAISGPSRRVGKVFADYLRNGQGATTVAAFSARARPGMGVSMPVAWEDLPTLTGGAQWTIANARDHLSLRASDPWHAYWRCRQSLAKAMDTFGFQ
ncbi:MAG: DNA ligase D [Burkholderiaceae bacterium]